MNTKKHKHKNRGNKQPNPSAEVAKSDENVEKCAEVPEIPADRTPENIATATEIPETVPVIEVKEEVETPVKPKRNKNKKKKQDSDKEDLTIEKVETVNVEVPKEVPIDIAPEVEPPDDKKEECEKDTDAAVAPSARKKKNKKKNQEKQAEPKVHEEKHQTLPEIEPVLSAQVDVEVNELFASTPEPKEGKSKKKNKKKKRTDSERSEEACTSAFQKLLVDEEEVKEECEIKVEDVTKDTQLDTDTKTDIIPEVIENIPEIIPPPASFEEPKQIQKDEGKGKKKNKKDKKHSQKEQHEEKKIEMATPIVETMPEFKIVDQIIEPNIEQPSSPKPKAKIAKPVEKKKNEKPSLESIPLPPPSDHEDKTDVVKEECKTDKEKNTEIKEPIEPVMPLITDIIDFNISKTIEEKKVIAVENISVPENVPMGKKRKKSPKPPKSDKKPESREPALPVIDQPMMEVEIKQIIDEPIERIIEAETVKQPIEAEQIKPAFEELLKDVIISVDTQVKVPEKTEETQKTETDYSLETQMETPKPEEHTTKSGKKKKKTPKIPTQFESSTDSTPEIKTESEPMKYAETIPFTILTTKHTDQETDKDKIKEIPTIPDIHTLPDIEVRSVRADESEGSACDVTPDIHFVRSSSQQQLDNNNNMTIQEINIPEEFKFSEPVTVPLIEGSGETPLGTPELLASDVQARSERKSAEKETIKSKMMEVNKDMEELRLSIERSLAEFSALEKTERDAEKDFETKVEQKHEDFIKETETQKVEVMPKVDISPDFRETVAKTGIVPVVPSPEPQETKCQETPLLPARKDKKGKSKKKGKQDTTQSAPAQSSTMTTTTTESENKEKSKKDDKENKENKQSSETKGKQQSDSKTEAKDAVTTEAKDDNIKIDTLDQSNLKEIQEANFSDSLEQLDYEPIEKFEDALTSSVDDVNKTFEMIAKDADSENKQIQNTLGANKPSIEVTEPDENTKRDEKKTPVSPPKNLLGHTDIPVPSNRTDYKKEKNKTPNERQAKVKIKDCVDVEKKISKESQTESKKVRKNSDKSLKDKDTYSQIVRDNEEYVYKYNFRKVFLQSACHVCKKDLMQFRIPCGYCHLVFYCGNKHKNEDYSQHQALCFAVSTIAHLKDQKHIYADARAVTGQDYRVLRMQMIVSCEKVLKRRLQPWEQEAMLYPRMCAEVACREWRGGKLRDCEGCGQISYCTDHPEHFPKTHQRWCKSYSLYAKLVCHQQTKGRLEPRLPTRVMKEEYEIPGKINEVLASMFEEKIEMNDIQYAALTQIATAPLTAAYCHQLYRDKTDALIRACNGTRKKTFVIHIVGAELQFEADALHKWEVFFLHLLPLHQVTVVMIGTALNPGGLPVELLGKVRMCDNCKVSDRQVSFSFQDKSYIDYRQGEDFINPDIICAFNPSIQRSCFYSTKDPWPLTISTILKQKTPFIITAYTLAELRKDIAKIKEYSEMEFKVIAEPILNSFASVRPDRNFITDDEMPLLFKNYCFSIICGC